ncbi:MAG: peptidase glycoprotease [Deltaproteobacteria bacterium]|nr:peptidase glycoprotease [Deltaproteobacteria bacterium]
MANRHILAIDNSMDFLNIALSGPVGLIDDRRVKESRSPSQILPETVESVLAAGGITLDDVSELRVTLGPGSFTGIRVGLSFCKGIRAALGTPIRGIPTLDALAYPLIKQEDSYLCPLIDARKSEVFLALYHASGGKLSRETGYMAVKPEDIPAIIKTPCICFGTGLRIAEKHLAPLEGVTIIRQDYDHIRAASLVADKFNAALDTTLPLNPIYGRRSEAEIKFNVTID